MSSRLELIEQKELWIGSEREEDILAEAIIRRIVSLERYPNQEAEEEVEILASILDKLGYCLNLEEE